jgi:hypothetical protein
VCLTVVSVLEVRDDQGNPVCYVTATEAPDWLGDDVTVDMVNKWHRRRKVTGFRVGREVFFRLDELREVEQVTRDTPGGHPRPGT